MKMKKLNLFIIVSLLISSLSSRVQAQSNSNGLYLFKMWLFIEHTNDHSREIPSSIKKDSTIYHRFENDVNLKVDTLKSNDFLHRYLFLSLIPSKGVSYRLNSNLIYLSIPGDCDSYVICVNKYNGTSFRLKGFLGNDLIALIREIGESNGKNLSTKSILKKLEVETIDFKCIYEGLISGGNNLDKYPCLNKCTNQIMKI